MLDRKMLKDEAKIFLSKYYLKALVVVLITVLLGGTIGGSGGGTNTGGRSAGTEIVRNDGISNDGVLETEIKMDRLVPVVGRNKTISLKVFFLISLIFLVLAIIVGYNVTIGANRFFLQGLKDDAEISYVFSSFKDGSYMNIMKVMLFTNIKIGLWTLLFIIPGIIKSIEYSMVPLILAENPEISTSEAHNMSRELTYGKRWDIFVLDLSFIGWRLISILIPFLGPILLAPYVGSTYAALYNNLKASYGVRVYNFD